jgi:hypothetical protein
MQSFFATIAMIGINGGASGGEGAFGWPARSLLLVYKVRFVGRVCWAGS